MDVPPRPVPAPAPPGARPKARSGLRGRRLRLPAFLGPRAGRHLTADLQPLAAHDAATRFPVGLHDPAFTRLVERIIEGPILDGFSVGLTGNGAAGFAEITTAIEAARDEVLVETYILRDDETGQVLRRVLSAAARRGVRCCVLADAYGSGGTSDDFWLALGREGVAVRLYHRFLTHPWQQLLRDHRKIVVVDRRIAFTGGMNIGDEYGSSRAPTHSRFRDTLARVDGSCAAMLATVFAEGWAYAAGPPLPTLELPTCPGGPARGVVLSARPGRGHTESAALFATVIGAARRSLWITNAYFCPPRALIALLAGAVARGVDVRLMLPGRSDVPIVRHAAHATYASLLAAGVRVFEYRPAILHTKMLVADDFVTIVGSSNLDVRSFRYNAECNLLVLDEETGAAAVALCVADAREADEITATSWSGRSLPHRLLDAAARALGPFL